MTTAPTGVTEGFPETDESPILRHVERVMGTVVSFDVRRGLVSASVARRAIRHACVVLARADAVFSLWKPSSPMSGLRRGELALGEVPPEIPEVLDLCAELRTRTLGWFDPWAMPGGVDPTGIVKGWAASWALAVLMDSGVAGAMVNAGGDVATSGQPTPGTSWRIGITDPRDRTLLLCAVSSPGAVATSGTYERGAHIIDPFTKKARSRLLSATVLGADLTVADGLATGLCAAGARGAAFIVPAGYRAIIVDGAGVVRQIGDVAAS